MLIVCPNCATSYRVDASSLGGAGRSVRCVRCRNVWFASDPSAPAAIGQDHRAEVSTIAPWLSADEASAPVGPPQDMTAADVPSPKEPLAESEPAAPELQGGSHIAAGPAVAAEWLDQQPLPETREPIAMADAPALAPMEQSSRLPADAVLGEDIETFAARRAAQSKRGQRWSLSVLPLAILALIALNAALIGWRADVVRVAPQTASLYA